MHVYMKIYIKKLKRKILFVWNNSEEHKYWQKLTEKKYSSAFLLSSVVIRAGK